PANGLALQGTIIAWHDALVTLPAHGADLRSAIQAALDAQRSSALVQPGEHYYLYAPGQLAGPVLATQPLRATLTYQLVTVGGYSEPCDLDRGQTIPCRFPGQNCGQLCTVLASSVPGTDATHDWIAAALVRATWQYATLDGHVLAHDIAESFGMQLAVLRISWDGSAWQVTPIVGHTLGLDVADDLACDPAREWLGQTSWSFMLTNPPPGERALFASDATPTDGCVVVLEHGAPAIFLERFGLLLTVNDAARNPTDTLSAADPAEQLLAQRLLAQLQP
ncbi:MAG TPA: hypothetical protein VGN32_19590, partial [Ktedonobacterales bacterium]|nr:hypothetical protein [Ktedonobacterales bacterium]